MPIIGSPLSRGIIPSYHESSPLRSPRDADATGKQWIRGQQVSKQVGQIQNALSATNRTVQKMVRKKPTPIIPQVDTTPVLPFELYQISKNNNRAFQLRDGYIAARSKYWINSVNSSGGSPAIFNATAFDDVQGNFEQYLTCVCDGQGQFSLLNTADGKGNGFTVATENTASAANMQLTTDVQISGYDASGNPVSFDHIVVPDIKGQSGATPQAYVLSVWAEIKDDSTKGFYANVWGRMSNGDTVQTGGDFPVTQSQLFPSGENIVPLAAVNIGYSVSYDAGLGLWVIGSITGGYSFLQIQCGNLVNRFPNYAWPSSSVKGNPMMYRGKWSADSLSGQVFYPGDWVYDDSGGSGYLTKTLDTGAGSFKYRGQYIYKSTTPSFCTIAPNADSSKWQYIGAVI